MRNASPAMSVGDVRVEDGAESALVACMDRRLRRDPVLSSSRTRSLMRTLASIAMPSVRAIGAMPGSVSVACSIDRSAMRNSRFAQSASVRDTPKASSRR